MKHRERFAVRNAPRRRQPVGRVRLLLGLALVAAVPLLLPLLPRPNVTPVPERGPEAPTNAVAVTNDMPATPDAPRR